MSANLLYYSNFCSFSQTLLQQLSKSSLKNEFHFVCIDKRRYDSVKKKTYVVLENGQELILPPSVTKVPALLNLADYSVIFGEDIYNYISPKEKQITQAATMDNMEPMAFSLGGGEASQFGIFSDKYSFCDMDNEDLSAKGNGGRRQMHNYISLDANENIYTPKENTIDKTEMTVEKIQQLRENDIKRF